MSDLPALVKSYQFNKINQGFTASGTALTDQQTVTKAIVDSMIGQTSNHWTCLGSSDSTTAALDNTNRWTTIAKLVFSGGSNPHSWIVLKQAGASNVQLLIDLHYFSGQQFDVYLSFAGFTGGSTTARPTAADEKVIGSGAIPFSPSSASYRLHVWSSTDGAATYVVLYSVNAQMFFMAIGATQNVPTALTWTNPVWATCQWGGSALKFSNIGSNAFSWGLLGAGTPAWCSFSLTTEYTGPVGVITTSQNYPDDDTGEYPFTPIGLFSTTASHRGRKATIVDLWWGESSNNSGDNYPGSGTLYQFVQYGDLTFPWDSATPPATA